MNRNAATPFDWLEFALCAETDINAWFPSKGGRTSQAKELCFKCEVREQCLAAALTEPLQHGIRGGMSPRQRRKLVA
jgi:WhiB family redox-sensing transcriptional regulator